MITVEYSSNNSGGRWWLKDEDWKALEAAGWKVQWVKDEEEGPFRKKGQDRWLGALAKSATIDCEVPGDAIRSFEKVTGQDASDEGCNCCGPPHSFNWTANGAYDYASGEGTLRFAGDGFGSLASLSKRELIERLAKGGGK